ncbi:MAG: hypothetical protein R6V02_12080 [Candidatus Aminicenantes bacterium]
MDKKQAVELQKTLSKKSIKQTREGEVRKIAEVDAKYERKTERT